MKRIFLCKGPSFAFVTLFGSGLIAVLATSSSPASALPAPCNPARIAEFNADIDFWTDSAFFWTDRLLDDQLNGASQETVDADQSNLDTSELQMEKAEEDLSKYQASCT